MKLISLNIWGGKLQHPLMDFIKNHSQNTDIFCFQEVFKTTSDITEQSGFRLNLYDELSKLLQDYQGYFVSSVDNYVAGSFAPDFIDFNLSWGLAIFIKKNIQVVSTGDFFVYGGKNTFNPKDTNTFPKSLQYLTFLNSGKKFIICNLHGIWLREGKKDSPSRISQSNQINDFLGQHTDSKILCGDLNLDMDTESVLILEKNLRNLIKEYKITTTRNKYFPGNEKFADYIFVSKDILVENFQVPNLEISDHLPMILEFS